MKELAQVRIRAHKHPESYPVLHVAKCIMAQGGKRTIRPMRPDEAERLMASWNRKMEAARAE